MAGYGYIQPIQKDPIDLDRIRNQIKMERELHLIKKYCKLYADGLASPRPRVGTPSRPTPQEAEDLYMEQWMERYYEKKRRAGLRERVKA